ncbi:MAG: sulfotransferase family protein, partial [Burkholderiales bacterium]
LLYTLLNAHSRLFIGRETALFSGNRNLGHLSKRTGMRKDQLEAMYHSSKCYPEFTQCVLSTLAAQNGKTRWGDKSPGSVNLISEAFRFFPKARFIHVVRDGRDAVCSIRTHLPSLGSKYSPVNPWSECVELWESWTQHGITWRNDPRYFELKYENLAQSPESTLRELLGWLGEPWEATLLNKARLSEVPRRPDVSQPVSFGSVSRWISDLPAEARKLFAGPPNDLLIKLSYAENEKWITHSFK